MRAIEKAFHNTEANWLTARHFMSFELLKRPPIIVQLLPDNIFWSLTIQSTARAEKFLRQTTLPC